MEAVLLADAIVVETPLSSFLGGSGTSSVSSPIRQINAELPRRRHLLYADAMPVLKNQKLPNITGPWSANQVHQHLQASTIPLRLAVNGAQGVPVVLSLWFVPKKGHLWCATIAEARVIALIKKDPNCGFEISADMPPYRGVRGQARASLHPSLGAEILDLLLERYKIDRNSRLGRFLLSRVQREIAIQIEPTHILSWDYSDRMKGATGAPAETC